MSLRAALYLYSTVLDPFTAKAQCESMMRYAADHGLSIVAIYEDYGPTDSEQIGDRRSGARLMEEVTGGRLDTVVVCCLNCVGSKATYLRQFYRVLQAHGVELHAVKEGVIDEQTLYAHAARHSDVILEHSSILPALPREQMTPLDTGRVIPLPRPQPRIRGRLEAS